MKKLSLVLALVLVFSLTMVSYAQWIDGTYEAWSDASAKSIQYAKIFIEDGKLVGVILREFTDKLVEKDWTSYPWPEAGEAARTLGKQFVDNQAAVADIVTGATGSSNGFIQAVERALIKASPEKPANKYFDGVFMGRSDVSSYGQYYKVAWVTIKDDRVVDYKVQRVLPDGSIQDPADYNWPLEMARESYREAALEAEPGFVDIISGATGLTQQSNLAVRDALDRASTR